MILHLEELIASFKISNFVTKTKFFSSSKLWFHNPHFQAAIFKWVPPGGYHWLRDKAEIDSSKSMSFFTEISIFLLNRQYMSRPRGKQEELNNGVGGKWSLRCIKDITSSITDNACD